ncbi:MAG: tetratricopeptide repeat protein [Eubacterium sp.]|nr:tetratricopeptide repeat protein [Eubacterium sp.]
MENYEIWKVLGIEETEDMDAIVAAYRAKLVSVNPEDDAEGFMKLREAFEGAVNKVQNQEQDNNQNNQYDEANATDIEKHIHKFDLIYDDILNRNVTDKLEEWLDNPLCIELDTADELRELLLADIMERFMLPPAWWDLLDKTFDIKGSEKELKEIFPPDFINFVVNSIDSNDGFGFDLIRTREEFKDNYALVFGKKFGEGSEKCKPIVIEANSDDYTPPVYVLNEDAYIRSVTQFRIILNDIYRILVEDTKEAISKEILESIPEDLAESEREEFIKTKTEERKNQYQEEIDTKLKALSAILEYENTFSIWNPEESGNKIALLELLGKNDPSRMQEAKMLAEAIVNDGLLDFLGKYNHYTFFMAMRVVLDQVLESIHNPDIDSDSEEIQAYNNRVITKCKAIIEELEKEDSTVYTKYCRSQLLLIDKKYEAANEEILDALDINSNFYQGVLLLKKISSIMIADYFERLKNNELDDVEKVELGWSLFRLDRHDKIFEVLEQTEKNDENAYGYNNLYAREYYMQEKYQEALPYLLIWEKNLDEMKSKRNGGEELSIKDMGRVKRSSFCYYLIGDTYQQLGDNESALKYLLRAYESAKKDIPDDINEILFYLEKYGMLLQNMERYQDAMDVWNEMVDFTDHCVPGYIHRQRTAYDMRDAQLVIDDYYNIIMDYPDYPQAYALAARVFVNFNQYDDAEKVIERAENQGLESDSIDMVKAQMFYQQGKIQDAEKLYEKVRENLYNKDSDIEKEEDAYSDISYFYMNMKDEDGRRSRLDIAEKCMKKGLELYPDCKRLLWIMTDIEEFNKRDVCPVYDKMLEIYPDDAAINFEYGEYYNRLEERNKAVEQYELCLEKDENHRQANNRLMNFYQDEYNRLEDRNFYDKAVAYATRQLEIIDDGYYRIERGLLYMDGYDFAGAIEDATKAIEQDSSNPYAHNCLGVAKMRSGDFMGALKHFNDGIEVQKNELETRIPYTNAAKCCEQMGEFRRALDYLEKSKDAFGHNNNVEESIARLYIKSKQFKQAMEIYSNLVEYNKRRLEETRNGWYDDDVIRFMIRKVECAHLGGDEKKAALYLQEIMDYIKDRGYLTSFKEISNNQRRVYASIFRRIADHLVNNERNYKDAILYFEKAIRYKMPIDSDPSKVVSLSNIFKKGNIFARHSKKDVYIEKPEDYMNSRSELRDMSELYRYFAAACYGYGLKDWAKVLAKRAEECLKRGYKEIGGIEAYLKFPQSSPLRYSDYAMIKFFMGEKEEAFKLAECCSGLMRCDFCYYDVCYDKILSEARLYEMQGNIKKAIECYEMARKYSLNDCEIYIALRTLSGKA